MGELEDTVAVRLRAIMAEFYIESNRAFAEVCHSNESAVNQWLRGENLPRVPQMIFLCEKTGLTLDWIYSGKTKAADKALVGKLTRRITKGHIKQKVIRAPRSDYADKEP